LFVSATILVNKVEYIPSKQVQTVTFSCLP